MSSNYDLLVQINEALLNKGLAALYYKGLLKISGEFNFIEDLPPDLQHFTKLSYKFQLKNEPMLDFRGKDSLFIKFAVELKLVILGGVKLEFDVNFSTTTTLSFAASARKLFFDLSKAEITDIYINNTYRLPKTFLDNVNQIIKIVLGRYFTADLKQIEIPGILYNFELPQMPDGPQYQIPISLGDLMITNNKLITIGINFFNKTAVDFGTVTDLCQGSDFYTSFQKTTLYKIFDLWWDHTLTPKNANFSGSLPVNAPRFIEQGPDLLTRLVTLGFLQTKTDYQDLVLHFEGSIKVLEKPKFSFLPDQRVVFDSLAVQLKLSLKLMGKVIKDVAFDTSSFIPDSITPWKDDIALKHQEDYKQILAHDQDMTFSLSGAEATVTIGAHNELVLDIVRADFNLELGSSWLQNLSEKVVNGLLNLIEQKIIDKIPNITISPALLLDKLDIAGYTLELNPRLIRFTNEALEIALNLDAKELVAKPVPIPIYIGNTKTMKLHRYDCPSVNDIDLENRVGYFVLYEALKSGYHQCKACIGSGEIG